MNDVIKRILSIDGLLGAASIAIPLGLWASLQFGWWL